MCMRSRTAALYEASHGRNGGGVRSFSLPCIYTQRYVHNTFIYNDMYRSSHARPRVSWICLCQTEKKLPTCLLLYCCKVIYASLQDGATGWSESGPSNLITTSPRSGLHQKRQAKPPFRVATILSVQPTYVRTSFGFYHVCKAHILRMRIDAAAKGIWLGGAEGLSHMHARLLLCVELQQQSRPPSMR